MPYPARISNYRRIVDEEGRERDQVTLIATHGMCTLNFDPETRMLATARTDYSPPDSPVPAFRIRSAFEFDPKVYDVLPKPIVFDPPEGARRVDSLAIMFGRADRSQEQGMRVGPGDPAPGFEEYTLDGLKIRLQDELEKGVVVLAFWSVASTEARQGLSVVDELRAWARESGGAVVWPVNTREREGHKSDRWTRAFEWWEQTGFREPSLFDAEFRIAEAYGVEGVPVTVVIRSDGIVHEIIAGFSRDWPDRLKASVAGARAATEDGG